MVKVASSVNASNEVNVRREAEILAALKAQKQRVLELRAQHDQIAVLQRDVESAQRAYELVSQRLSQTKIESQAQTTNIAVLTEATPPHKPSNPRPVLYTAIGAALGLLLGLAFAIRGEIRAPRLRSEDDVVAFLGLPVLETLPTWKHSSRSAKLADRHRLSTA